MSKVERLRDRARTAEARDPRAAIDTWLEVLRFEEDDAEPNPDLSIYNRIGDLYLKIKDPGQAADYYERGVDRYAELGFHNNAIALNKVLRNAGAPDHLSQARQAVRREGIPRRGAAELRGVRGADEAGGAGRPRVRRPQAGDGPVARERQPASHARGAPADLR
jgi:tetratricopeptide (TPR) repeat protein